MKKGNKTRLIFWGIIWIVVLSLAGFGYYSYLNGHGIKGEVRHNLKPIVEKFNNLKGLEAYKKAGIDISAEIKETQIVVNYKTSGATASFTFDYQNIASEKVLYMKYSTADEATANLIIKSMIESVSIVNGHTEGEVFNRYKLEDFFNTTILEGVQIKSVTNGNEIYIDINKSIIDGIKNNENNTENTIVSINEEDLNTLKNDLTTQKESLIQKDTITLYVTENTKEYTIYIVDTNQNNNNYISVSNVIKILTNEETLIKFNTNIKDLNSNQQFENIKITINKDVTSIEKLTVKNNVTEIVITK
ncbi:MAG: hypothetical protein MSH48_02795 [Mollicutes bacterium]|nr:hypothetical protein [Mollicutes bacterium]